MLITLLRYLWALPTSMVGIPFVLLALVSGGGVRIVGGVIEVEGKAAAFFLRHCTLLPGGASAMTLGHVVIGLDRRALERTRRHERVHVRQCERWGPLFIPAYLLASLLVKMQGRDGYRDNPFEVEAYAIDEE